MIVVFETVHVCMVYWLFNRPAQLPLYSRTQNDHGADAIAKLTSHATAPNVKRPVIGRNTSKCIWNKDTILQCSSNSILKYFREMY